MGGCQSPDDGGIILNINDDIKTDDDSQKRSQ